MQLVMKTVIVLHNMVVEERCHAEFEDGDEITQGIVVSITAPPMWEGLVRTNGTATRAERGTLATTFELESFKEDLAEHDVTKRLLVDHLWNHHGNE